jgi:hypothetical protein
MNRTKVTTAIITKCDQEMKIIPHEKDSGFFNRSTSLQICSTVVAHPLMEQSWDNNSYEK